MPCVPVGDPVLVHSPGPQCPSCPGSPSAPRLPRSEDAGSQPRPLQGQAGKQRWSPTDLGRAPPVDVAKERPSQSRRPVPGTWPRHPCSPAPLFPSTPAPGAPWDPCPPESLFPGIPAPGTPAPQLKGQLSDGAPCLAAAYGGCRILDRQTVRTAYLPTAERPRGGGPQVRVQKDSASSAGQGDRPSRLLRTVPRPLPHASWPGAWAEARSPGSWSHRVEASWPAAMDLPVDSAVLTGFAPRPGPPHGRVAPMSWKPRPPTTQPLRPRTLAPRKTAVLGSGGPLSQPSSTSPCASGQRAPPALGCSPVPSPSLGETPGPPAEVVVNRPTPGPWTGGRSDQDRP